MSLCVCVCACVHACMCAWLCPVCMRVYVHACVRAYMSACVHACKCMCICVHACVLIECVRACGYACVCSKHPPFTTKLKSEVCRPRAGFISSSYHVDPTITELDVCELDRIHTERYVCRRHKWLPIKCPREIVGTRQWKGI